MKLVASLAVALVMSLTTASAFADLIEPDAGNNSNNATNNETNQATTPPKAEEDKSGCSVASLNAAAPAAPMLLGLALLGLARRRRA